MLNSPKPKYSCVKFFSVFWNEEDEAESIQGARNVAKIFKERFGAVTTEIILEPRCYSWNGRMKVFAPTFDEDFGDAENLVVYYITGHGSKMDEKTQLKVCSIGTGSFAFRDFSDL